MAGIFWDGSDSDLSATVTSTAPSYPILFTAWIECNESPDDDCVLVLSDDGAGGSLDALQLRVASGTGTVSAVATAAGSSSTASQTGLAATGRQFVAAYFESASSRKVKVGTGAWGTAETTTRAVGKFTKVSIGALHNGGVTASFDGPICHAAIWTGVDADHVDLMVDQLARGVKPSDIWHVTTAYLYQPLETAANQTGKLGPTLTATAVQFQSDIEAALASEQITAEERYVLITLANFNKLTLTRTFPNWDPAADQLDRLSQTLGHDVISFRWPDDTSTPGPLPTKRIVVLGSDSKIVLAAADSANWIGATVAGRYYATPPPGDESTWWRQMVRLRDGSRPIVVDEASGATFTVGASVAYIAADGKCDDTGTVAIGIVIASADGVATVLPY